ncbi:hypothetical protein [Nocardiopsis composta]|uniref:Uncharacterized protein n=1 Tax=Nocardiopsis composta TaxID=157465 RepID=A0A7W8VCX7_9ACTN|nr:hypothetical protein [Nocardiopsis composta]MBB5431349.1 hypothetical protein [Nocardiopsis composta]
MAPIVHHADAELAAITWLRPRLPEVTVCSERPLPDAFAAALPIVQITRLPSPPSHRWVHDIARMQWRVMVPESWERPGAIDLAAFVGAQVAAMSQAVIPVLEGVYTPAGTVAVTQVARQTAASEAEDPNDSVIAFAFTAELYLRPLRVA